MNTQEIVAKLWNLCNVLRDDGITYHQYVTELTYILFLKMAKETGVEIVPIAVEQYGNKFYFNIGKNYGIAKSTTKTEVELNCELRDKLATLKWQILETQPIFQRDNVPEGYIYDFQKEIVEKCNYGYGFSLEDAISESFHDKNITSEEEVFSFLENLDININNAFLLRGHSKKLKK